MSRRAGKKRSRKAKKQREAAPRPRPFLNLAVCFVFGFLLAGGVSMTVRATSPDRSETDVSKADLAKPDVPQPSVTVPTPAAVKAATTHFQRGLEYFKRELLAEAHREFTRAAALDPTSPEPQVGLGKVYQALDYDERAERAYRNAITLDPRYHGARVALARLLIDCGRNEESLALLTDRDKTNQNDPWVWAAIAGNHMHMGRSDRAIPLLERYNAAAGPGDAWGYENLGRALTDVGRLEEAERVYRRALAVNPRTELAHLLLGQLLVADGRGEEAKPLFEQFHRLRSAQTAERELEQAIARRPENVKAHISLLVRLFQVRQFLGKPRQAIVPLRRAVELAPEDERLRALYETHARRPEGSPPK